MARLWTLIALVALLVMPLGMGVAPAMAAPAAAAGHCDEHQQPADSPVKAQIHCTGCVGLPVLEAPTPSARFHPEAPPQPALAETVAGLEPGTDPPPPKRS